MTENNQRASYIFYFAVTTLVATGLALIWFMSPLGLGFATWPETYRNGLQHIYESSYYLGIPMLLVAQIISPALFIFRKRKAAYWLPAGAIALFLAPVILIVSSLR